MHISIVITLSLIIFKTVLALTDNVNDRPTAPWGYFESLTTLKDLLIHYHSFTGELYSKTSHEKLIYNTEGHAYLGVVTTFFVIVGLVHIYRNKNCKDFKVFHVILPASLFVLMFATGLPFIIEPFKKYYDYMPFTFKQFRAAGRFSWIFYYTASLFSVVVLKYFIDKLSVSRLYLSILFLFFSWSVWFCEFHLINKKTMDEFRMYVSDYNEEQDKLQLQNKLLELGLSDKDFQAILPVPQFLFGSEKIGEHAETMTPSLRASLFTGLPVAGGELSRTSLNQTFQLVNLFSEPYVKKDILKHFKSTQPLLTIAPDSYQFPVYEKRIIDSSHYLFSFQGFSYYSTPINAFQDISNDTRDNLSIYTSTYNHYINYQTNDSVPSTVYINFDSLPSHLTPFGIGALDMQNKYGALFNGTLTHANGKQKYELSFWVYAHPLKASFNQVYLREINSENKLVFETVIHPEKTHNTYQKWVRCSITFTPQKNSNRIIIESAGEYCVYDELMIKPIDCNTITQLKSDSLFMFNNFPIQKKGY